MQILKMKIKPELRNLSSSDFLNLVKQCSFSKKTEFNVFFVLEEMLANIIKYSNCTLDISIKLVIREGNIDIHLSDNGVEFDPVKRGDPDIDACPLEKPEGGFGIYLSKKKTDEMIYRREGNCNMLKMTLKID
jgi:serine/threonine-protein kinase RsbW